MGQAGTGLKWGVARRLEFIEFRLFWEGGVNRADIIEMFNVSVPQASKDLTIYQKRAPNNTIYDRSAERYVAGDQFKPRFLNPDPAERLNQLRSVSYGILLRSYAWIGEFPSYDDAPSPVRGVNAGTLRSVTTAIRQSEAIEVRYQSLSRPEPRWRWIAPHAIAFDGFRWHARAYCETETGFRDFLLSRILQTRGRRPSSVMSDADTDWHEYVTLEIGLHPKLSEPQRKVIALDYGMRGERAKIPVRKALLYYTLKRLGLDTDRAARRPKDQQIVLLSQEPKLNALGIAAVEG